MLPVKDIKRLQEIITVFVEEGLGYYVSKTKLKIHLPWHKRLKPSFPISNRQRQAILLRRSFERLGPTFVKLGQLLSLRPDLVPREYSEEFEKLQDHVSSFPYRQIKKIVEEDLQKPLNKIFSSFDKKPLASASIAQVHRAVLKSGKKVVVKVQRPDIREIIDTDLDILFHLARSLEKHFPAIKNYHPVDVVKEFAIWTRRELNFEIEARNAATLREKLKNNKNVIIPKVYPGFSSKRILIMDFVDGFKINDLAALEKYHISRKNLVMTYFTSILEQALLHGLFHADPHPANIFVQKSGKLAYIDYGIVGELTPQDRKKIIRFINSINEKNPQKSMDIVVSLAKDISKANLSEFKLQTMPILEEAYKNSVSENSMGKALYDIISRGAQYNVIFDPNHILMAKSIYQAEGLALSLYPQFKVSEGLDEFSKKYLQENYAPSKIAGKIAHTIWSQRELLEDLPEHLTKIIHKMETPEPPHQIDLSQLKKFEEEFEYVNKKRTVGIIASAFIISSAVLFYVEGRTTVLGVPAGIIMLVLALLLLLYFLFTNKKEV